jgi:hypothetical protein
MSTYYLQLEIKTPQELDVEDLLLIAEKFEARLEGKETKHLDQLNDAKIRIMLIS